MVIKHSTWPMQERFSNKWVGRLVKQFLLESHSSKCLSKSSCGRASGRIRSVPGCVPQSKPGIKASICVTRGGRLVASTTLNAFRTTTHQMAEYPAEHSCRVAPNSGSLFFSCPPRPDLPMPFSSLYPAIAWIKGLRICSA